MSKPLQRVETLWFDKGADIVLQAEDRIFRVPRSILTARSPVFRNLLEIPAEGDEIMDGVPVIQLSESAEEIEAFLKAIYDSSYFMPPPATIGFHEVFAILRLSHKYDVDYLFRRAIEHLETRYPQNLKETDMVERSTVQLPSTGPPEVVSHEFALKILHEVEALWLLPYAYYLVAAQTTLDYLMATSNKEWCPPSRRDIIVQARMCQVAATDRMLDTLTHRSNCATPDKCDLKKFAYLKQNLNHGRRFYFAAAPMRLADRQKVIKQLCPTCATAFESTYHVVQQQIWSQLPRNCGLPSWDVLGAMRHKRLYGESC
ncbi:BTB domain-containing protein [Favolaschia claudopus]|uniref:BTB domain-containing protein n=1 Tax=Favolaschia claudopus TaxID=2862362 RepID=A0AAV9ZIV2_9AGAR